MYKISRWRGLYNIIIISTIVEPQKIWVYYNFCD